MTMRTKFLSSLAFGLLLSGGLAFSQDGWLDPDSQSRRLSFAARFAGLEPSQPESPPPAQQMQMLSLEEPSRADEITPEIESLARGLRHDAWSIYQYCWERVSYEPYWGSKKGATTTLLEGSGNCFDTASLMVALLKASGFEDVGYRYGQRFLFDFELQDWLGLLSPIAGDGDPFPHLTDQQFRDKFGLPGTTTVTEELRYDYLVLDYLAQSGSPNIVRPDGFSSGAFLIPHVWVTFKDSGGVVREMDPSVKWRELYMEQFYRPTGTDIGYNRTTFLSGLGGTLALSGRQISGIATTGSNGLGSKLSDYTEGFRSWLRSDYNDAYADDFINRNHPGELTGTIGGHSLVPGFDYETSDPLIEPTTWPEMPKEWETRIFFTFGNNYDPETDEFGTEYGSADIPTNILNCGTLSLTNDGTTVRLRHGEEVLATATVTDASYQFRMAVDHAVGEFFSGSVFTDTGFRDQQEVKTYQRNNDAAYAIIYGFSPSPQHLRKSQKRLDAYRGQGLDDGNWEVRTEALNVMGLNYLVNAKNATRMVSTRVKALERDDHTFGRMSQEEAYYIDVGLSSGYFYSYAGRDDTRRTAFHVSSHFASALEHGVIEQLQGPGVQALSTMRIFQLANAQGHPLHLVDNSNWSSVRSTLATGNGWQTAELDLIESGITGSENIGNNAQIMVPRRGDIGLTNPPTAGQWRGYGYALASNVSSGMFISGGYSGGYLASGSGSVSSDTVSGYGQGEPGYYSMNSFLNPSAHDPLTVPKWAAADPVDMATGAFILDASDMQCGFPMPRGLAFHRSYSSNRSADDSQGIGYGWTHNLDFRASRRSATRAAFGETTPEQMAATYVSAMVAADVFLNRANAKDWAVTALTSCWVVDQIRDNGVSVQMGASSMEFVKMPNGDFVPPAGMTSTLSEQGGGVLALSERHGNTHNFNSDGRITSSVDQHGEAAMFAYKNITVGGDTRSVLDTVTDCFGREFELTWTGANITKVTESAGSFTREVNFTYDDGLLTDVYDPEGNRFQYGYADSKINSLIDGRGRIITENDYDSLGRVYQQRLHGDEEKLFTLYFSGLRNVEVNPEGGESVFIYDRYGRGVGQIDATGNRNSIRYDGQNRKIEAASPKNNGSGINYRPVRFEYDADHNETSYELPKKSATDANGPYSADKVYDGQLRLWKDYDLKGEFVEYTYTAKHQVYQIKDRKGQLVQTNSYNTDGTLATVTDAAGNVTKYLNYDDFGNPETIEYPPVTVNGVSVVPTESFVYSARGDLLQHTDRNGNLTETTHNAKRQPRVTTLPAVGGVSHTRETVYDSAGNASQMKDERGNWTVSETNQTGKLLSIRFPSTTAGIPIVTHQYDSRDWLERSIDPAGREVVYQRDDAGRISSVMDPLSRTTQSFYNADGELEETRDARNKSTFFRMNWRGELFETENALTHTSSNIYDANGKKDSYLNKRNKTFLFDYDDNGRLLSLKTPLLKETTRDWNSRGLATFVQEPSGDRSEFAYDNMGRLRETVHKQGGTTVSTITR